MNHEAPRKKEAGKKRSGSFSRKTNLLLLLAFVVMQIVIAIWTYFLLKSEGLI